MMPETLLEALEHVERDPSRLTFPSKAANPGPGEHTYGVLHDKSGEMFVIVEDLGILIDVFLVYEKDNAFWRAGQVAEGTRVKIDPTSYLRGFELGYEFRDSHPFHNRNFNEVVCRALVNL